MRHVVRSKLLVELILCVWITNGVLPTSVRAAEQSPEWIRQFGSNQFRASSRIRAIQWNLLGDEVTALDTSGSLRTWSVSSGKVVSDRATGISAGQAFEFGVSNTVYAVATEDAIDVFGSARKKPTYVTSEVRVDCLSVLDRDRKIIFPSRRGQLTVYDVVADKPFSTIEEIHDPQQIRASPDGKLLAVIGSEKDLRVVDLKSGKLKWVQANLPEDIQEIRFSPDGASLAAVDYSEEIRIWDANSGNLKRTLKAPNAAFISLCFLNDNQTLVSGDAFDHQPPLIRVWDIKSGKEIRTFPGDPMQNLVMVPSPDESILAVGGEYGIVQLIELKSGKLLRPREPGHVATTQKVRFSIDGKKIITASRDSTIGLWDSATGELLHQLRGHPSYVRELLVESNGRSFYSGGSYDSNIRRWDLESGKQIGTISSSEQSLFPITLASADGKSTALLQSFNQRIRVNYDGVPPRDIRTDLHPATRLFCPVPLRAELVLVSLDEIGFLDLKTEQVLRSITLPKKQSTSAAAISPSGHLIAISTGFDVVIYESATLRPIRKFDPIPRGDPFPRNAQSIRALAFLNESRLAVGGPDYDIRLFDLESVKGVVKLKGHVGFIESLALSPDGTQLLSGSSDSTAILWKVPSPKVTQDRMRSKIDPKQLWIDLKHEDPAIAYKAIWELGHQDQEAIALFDREIKPIEATTEEEIRKSILALGADRFAVRQAAILMLEKLDAIAFPALKRRLSEELSVGERCEIEALIKKQQIWSDDRLRELRAVQCLEMIGTPETRKQLEIWAGGVKEARLTQEAKAALERLDKRR